MNPRRLAARRWTPPAVPPDDGRLVHDLRSTTAGYGFVTGVAERDGVLVLASLHGDDLAVASVQ